MQPIAGKIGPLARNQGANTIEWTNSDSIANVHIVELIKDCWVCGIFRDKWADNSPMLYLEWFDGCRIKESSDWTADTALVIYLYNHSYLDWLSQKQQKWVEDLAEEFALSINHAQA